MLLASRVSLVEAAAVHNFYLKFNQLNLATSWFCNNDTTSNQAIVV